MTRITLAILITGVLVLFTSKNKQYASNQTPRGIATNSSTNVCRTPGAANCYNADSKEFIVLKVNK